MTFKKSLLYIFTYMLIFAIYASLVMVYSETKLRTLLLIAIALTLIIPFVIRTVKGKLDLFEPLVIADFSLFFMFLVRPLADLITGQTIHLGYTILYTFDEALFLSWVGIVCFQLGYFSVFGRWLSKRFPNPPTFQPGTAAISAGLFVFMGATLFAIFLNTQGGFEVVFYLLEGRQVSNNELFLRSTGYFYNGIMMWGPASLIFFAIAVVYNRIHMYLPFGMLILTLIILYGSTGTRSQLLPLVVSIPVFWYIWKRKRPSLKTVFLAGLVGLVLLSWLREVRTIETKYKTIEELQAVIASPFAAIGELITSGDAEMFDSMTNELLVVPEELKFMYGATFTDIFIRAVPRVLFPNKPLESNDEIVNALWPEHYAISRASPCFSVIGVFYADSGYITVTLGMFFLGALLTAFWRWFQTHSNSVIAQIIYSMGLPFVVILLRGNIPDTLARMLFYFAPLLIFFIYKGLHVRIGSESQYSKGKKLVP